jgi:hypothetical protein
MLLDYFVDLFQLADGSFEKLIGEFPHFRGMFVHLPESAQNFILRMLSDIQLIQHLERALARCSTKSHDSIRRDSLASRLQLLHQFNHFDCSNRSVKAFVAGFEPGTIHGLFHRIARQDTVDYGDSRFQSDGTQFFGHS